MDLRIRLLLWLLSGSGALALAAAALVWSDERVGLAASSPPATVRNALAHVERSDGQQLSHFATPLTDVAQAPAQPRSAGRMLAVLLPMAVLLALAGWWLIVREFQGMADGLERLRASLARSRDETQRMGCELLAARDDERCALARELHDEFGQNLAVMVSAAGYMERHAATASAQVMGECARDVRVAASQMARQVRGHLRRLHPQGLQGTALRAALDELVAGSWLSAAGVRAEMRWAAALPELSPEGRLALYRTVQEALTNVVRHASASRVVVALGPAGGGWEVSVEDDGRGHVVQAALQSSGSGIRGMRERAEGARGRLALGASGLGGLRVNLWLPLSGSVEDQQGDKNHGECVAAG